MTPILIRSLPRIRGWMVSLVTFISLNFFSSHRLSLSSPETGFSSRPALSAGLRAAYEAMPAGAGACTECGACVERCPFGVDVVENMRLASRLFERRREVVELVWRG